MNRYGVFAVLLVVLASTQAASRVKRVIGGQEYAHGDYPFLVSLWYMGDNNIYNTQDLYHSCGGSLIEENWVLTAGTVFDDYFLDGLSNTSLWKVVLGMHGQREAPDEATFMNIESIFRPSEYNHTNAYGDIALLKLTEDAVLSDKIDTIDYNNESDCPATRDACEVIGWGQNQTEVYGLGLNFPHMGVVYATNQSYCHDAHAPPAIREAVNGIVIDESYLCAGRDEGGVDGCYGDSGSPLLSYCDGETTVVGIMSTGYGCAKPGFPGIYTRVSFFATWIKETIRDYD